ncbi:hypothetical protein LTR86_003966 [Recurvomyces mirabilis]|nr:hypothetical protein LTR86_003966 [Recurvomyces mirabilis]
MAPQSVQDAYDQIDRTWDAYDLQTSLSTWVPRRLPSANSFRLLVIGHLIATPPPQHTADTLLEDRLWNEAFNATQVFMATYGPGIWDVTDPSIRVLISPYVLDYIWALLQDPAMISVHDLQERRAMMHVVRNRRQGRRGSLPDSIITFEQTADGDLPTFGGLSPQRGRSLSASPADPRPQRKLNELENVHNLARQLAGMEVKDDGKMQQQFQSLLDGSVEGTSDESGTHGERLNDDGDPDDQAAIQANYANDARTGRYNSIPQPLSGDDFDGELEEGDFDTDDENDIYTSEGEEQNPDCSPRPVPSQFVCDIPIGQDRQNGAWILCGEAFPSQGELDEHQEDVQWDGSIACDRAAIMLNDTYSRKRILFNVDVNYYRLC